jgi:hypothetical protein
MKISPSLKRLLVNAVATLAISISTHAAIHRHHPLKHTWECRVLAVNGHSFWFVRPNNELFEAYFDNPPLLRPGMPLSDIAYTDDNADQRHFVKATFKPR